jgi:ABC-type glycerol-3-phosphate transport system permease component
VRSVGVEAAGTRERAGKQLARHDRQKRRQQRRLGGHGTSRNTDWGGLMAASTLTAIPVVVFFLIVQRRIAFGLTAGAVRG